MKNITLKIDGKTVKVKPGTTILEAGKSVGIDIPTLCHHEKLKPYGACRMCMVEITKGKRTRLVASCCYLTEEGLVVKTDTERINKIRKMIVELLLPLAPTGPMQSLAKKYGIKKSRFPVEGEPPYCTLCGLCVRYCAEVKGENAVGFIGRGVERQIAFVPEKANICVSCTECYSLCEAGKFVPEAEVKAT